MFSIRDDIENVVKEQNINRENFFEVSKHSHRAVTKKIENTFVDKTARWDKDIHWSNMGHYKKNLFATYIPQKEIAIVDLLPLIIPKEDESIYFLVEDNSKYWLYEGGIKEICLVLNESPFYDFYIVSKKYDWLISQNHHDVWSFISTTLNLSVISS